MNPNDFRRIALGMEDVIESSHMGHPDFRAKGRIFATIHPDHQWGMVKLTPDLPASPGWSRPGWTGPCSGSRWQSRS
ncbi:MAG: hypothetical protein DMG07_02670 [Acidobacteria bacterium]|nr:MAG: hypothetical protein DMG07_02670 [Acidobacteriota bacterium]